MAYKDIADRKAASKRHYLENKAKYLERNTLYRANISKFVRQLKESSPCADCSKSFPYYVMDFDHMENKKFEVNFLASSGRIGALKREIEKCEIVCSNCHRMRSHARLQEMSK